MTPGVAGAQLPTPTPTPSLRRRATIAVLGMFSVLLLVVGLATDLALGAQLDRELNTRLVDRAFRAESFSAVGYTPEQLPDLLAGRGIRVLVTATDGATYGDAGLAPFIGPAAPVTSAAQPAPSRPAPARGGPGGEGGPAGPAPRPALPAPPAPPAESSTVQVVDLANGARVLLVADTAEIDGVRTNLRLIMLAAGVLALLLAAVGLAVAVARALGPLDRLTGVARRITDGDRGRRLRPDRSETELGRAALAFDEMLDALETTEARARRSAAEAITAAAAARAAEARTRGFLSDAAHELRTPLTGMQVTAEQLAAGAGPDPRQQRRASLLLTETARASRLVGDMLDLARLDAEPALRRRHVDLAEVVTEQLQRAAMLAPTLHLTRTGATGLRAFVDPARIGQILTNLLDNARRHTPDGGSITVDLRREEPGFLAVTVTDTGPGVPDGDRSRIFDRLVRLDDARDRDRTRAGAAAGAGLGLAIARALARAHGGDLSCPAHRGGAVFRLTLPAAGPDAES